VPGPLAAGSPSKKGSFSGSSARGGRRRDDGHALAAAQRDDLIHRPSRIPLAVAVGPAHLEAIVADPVPQAEVSLDPGGGREGAAVAPRKAREPAAQEAREHPAVTDAASAGAAESMRVDLLRGEATADELAALIAVVTEPYAEESAGATADDTEARSGWSLSQRSLRTPLRRDLGWGRFGG